MARTSYKELAAQSLAGMAHLLGLLAGATNPHDFELQDQLAMTRHLRFIAKHREVLREGLIKASGSKKEGEELFKRLSKNMGLDKIDVMEEFAKAVSNGDLARAEELAKQLDDHEELDPEEVEARAARAQERLNRAAAMMGRLRKEYGYEDE